VLADKTGSLIATSGRFGALLSGADPQVTQRISDACEAIGVAWQLGDDIIDVSAPTTDSGKTPGTDLREGIRTLPVLYALQDSADARLRSLLAGPVAEDDVAETLTRLRADPAMARARAELDRWIDRAKDALAALPAIPARDALVALCDYVVERSG
jgi:heptaprenyl diphosphate synthase